MTADRVADRHNGLLFQIPFHTVLLPFSFATAVYARNRFEAELGSALLVTFAMMVTAALFVAIMRPLYRTWRRAGIAATTLLLFMLYGPNIWFAVQPVSVSGAVFLMVCVVVAFLLHRLLRTRSSLAGVTFALNVIVCVMPANDLWIAGEWILADRSRLADARTIFPDLPAPAPDVAKAAPDIWYLVPDRYTNNEVMQRVYQYDNSAFLDSLRERGFAVIDDAHANYQRTAVSMTSVLNLDYLDGFHAFADRVDNRDWRPYYRALEDNRVSRYLDRAGYEIHRFGPHWEPTRRDPHADIHHNVFDMPEFGLRMLTVTVPGLFAQATKLGAIDGWYSHCQRLQKQFADLATLAQRDTQKFVFAHLLITHPPFVMDADGQCLTRPEARQRTWQHSYRDAVAVTNREFGKLIDAILSGPRPAIIVLMSDEGPWPRGVKLLKSASFANSEMVEWTAMDDDQLDTKTGILMAMRVPENMPQGTSLPEAPVNVFRWILANAFRADLPPLADRKFIYASDEAIFDFVDVTDRLQR
jgi:hypothetical protein